MSPSPLAQPPAALSDALEQLLTSPYFDAHWYAQTYADVAMGHANPALHFLKYGALLARAASPDFSPVTHAEIYQEARRTGENPVLLHHRKQTETTAAAAE